MQKIWGFLLRATFCFLKPDVSLSPSLPLSLSRSLSLSLALSRARALCLSLARSLALVFLSLLPFSLLFSLFPLPSSLFPLSLFPLSHSENPKP